MLKPAPDMHVTVCICTRDRGASIATTIASIVSSTFADFDVIIVDQSVTDDSARAIHEAIASDSRFSYIHTDTKGASIARNIAVSLARGPIVAFTDDDCEVSPVWIELLAHHLAENPEVGCVCGEVRSIHTARTYGFIPEHIIKRTKRIASPWLKWRDRGILANMACRLDALRVVGPFDEVLGAGGCLYACEDGDMVYRMLRAGYTVLAVNDAYVIHHGFRTWTEGRSIMRRTGVGVGAAYMKHLRCGDLAILPTLFIEWLRCIHLGKLLLGRKRNGLARFLFYAAGMFRSFHYPIDMTTRTYVRTIADPLAGSACRHPHQTVLLASDLREI